MSINSFNNALKNIPESAVRFETVPTETYAPDPNRVALVRPEADVQFARLRDESATVVPTPTPTPTPTATGADAGAGTAITPGVLSPGRS